MEFSAETTLTPADWRQWVGRNIVVTDDGIALAADPSETDTRTGRAYRQFDPGVSMQWHRLTVNRTCPTPETQVRLSYFASDDPSPLNEPLWNYIGVSEPVLQEDGIDTVWDLLSWGPDELASLVDGLSIAEAADCLAAVFDTVETALSEQWQAVESASDLLLSEATGRYLTVRVELVGTPTTSPRISALRAFWPRKSSLQYLPELYRDDSESAVFLEQFLSVFDALFDHLEGEMESITRYFDPVAVPTEALPWLAELIGTGAPADWPTAATRDLLAAAPELYKKRGTRDGLCELLAIYLGHIEPLETFPSDRLVPRASTDSDNERLPNVDHGLYILEPQDLDPIESAVAEREYRTHLPSPQSVVVFAGPFDDPTHREAVAELVRRETPAHVRSTLVELRPAFTLGADSFLGCNTRLSERRVELGETSLGPAAILR